MKKANTKKTAKYTERFFFKFKNGGGNEVMAKNREQAIKLATKEYGYLPYFDQAVLEQTMKPVNGNEHEYMMQLRSFD